ncbi:TPM domain-containing protein [Kineococcus sp. TRM81007]|uniref:TPM domain-containing protein n=1 Tax=Kineococcus sp. TRM81007 TaxID=2925831 RepID=UPI001F584353|nr:TPM domain-containing protein [Kineococcus sp. TRM81007]MCI2237345.1 TPM domain-containing protein [Kineococcus sp. TRM81007]
MLRRPRPRGARRAAAAALLATGALTWSAATPAVAVEPFRLPGQVTDRVGALDGSDVAPALRELQQREGVQLWVVLVDSFDGEDPVRWADETALASGLGVDDVLLAVATEEGAFAYSVDDASPLSDADLTQLSRDTEAHLVEGDWSGAVVAGAESIDDALGGGFPWGWAAAGAVVVAGGGALLLARSRRGGTGAGGASAARGGEFAGTSTADLARTADALLVRADDAVRSSAEELEFATAEFGEQRTAGFRDVLAEARAALTAAFTARQGLDDAEPETEARRREVLTGIVADCRRVDETLEAASGSVDELRDLVRRAPEVLTGVEERLPALRDAVGPARQRLDALRGQFGGTALATVEDAPQQASERLDLAERSAVEARGALADPTRAGEVVDAVRAAQGALVQAEQLLTSVERTGTGLRRAVQELPVALARLRAAADAPAGASSPVPAELAGALAAARAVAASAQQQGPEDPLGALHRVVEAERALDAARDAVEETARERRQERAALEQALLAARAEVEAAEDFVATRRGAVGGTARTRLAEARRHLGAAVELADGDAAAALQHARTADALAEEAGRLARADASAWGAPGTVAGPGLEDLLGGVLLGGGRRRTGFGGSWGGGFGGGFGGFGGSWGGPGPSARRGRSGGFGGSFGGGSGGGRRSSGGGRRGAGGRF